ncbi:hypothetical protein KA071_00320 [Candidatus Gracilibacteria bacterium]|nr:hypothetical protein [Candidatus Gracilibacteria bacterium]
MKKYILLFIIASLSIGGSIVWLNKNTSVPDSELQEMCTKLAQYFLENHISNLEERKKSSFINNFNSKLDKCFVLVEIDKGNKQFSDELFDAVEKKSYGTIIGKYNSDSTSPDLIDCTIYNWKKENMEKCKSNDEFHQRVLQFLELNNL